MALIKTDYDLSGGNSASSEVPLPNTWRVTATTTTCPELQYVTVDLEVEDEQGNWCALRDENDLAIHVTLRGNETKSTNPILVNGANGRAVVRVQDGASGLINIDSINA